MTGGPFGLNPTNAHARRCCELMSAMCSPDPEVRQRARYAVAEDVVERLPAYRPELVVERPTAVASVSAVLAEYERGPAPPNTPRGITRALFVAWRESVLEAEQTNAARLLVVLRARATLRELGAEAMARRAEAFCVEVYGMPGDRWPEAETEMREAAAKHAARYDVLPWELRTLTRRDALDAGDTVDEDVARLFAVRND